MADRLRPLWDFDDLDSSERRFRAQLETESSDAGRAEVLTQLARIAGLRERFDDAERLLESAEPLAGESGAARTRVLLERGRKQRSSGDADGALPLFVSAFAIADEHGESTLAIDAAHMAALAAREPGARMSWTQRGIDLAEASADPEDRYWLGPLLNNLGWDQYAAGDHEAALRSFERALRAREERSAQRKQLEIARYAVAKTLRTLGRAAEAAPLLEGAVAWARDAGAPDGWFHEELAETYALLGRAADAREHAGHALALLGAADRSFTPDSPRAVRLRQLAG